VPGFILPALKTPFSFLCRKTRNTAKISLSVGQEIPAKKDFKKEKNVIDMGIKKCNN